MALGGWAKQRRGGGRGSFRRAPAAGCGHLAEEGRRGGEAEQGALRGGERGAEAPGARGAVALQRSSFVLEVVGVDELVQQVDGRALGFGVLHPEVPQVGPRVAG